MTLKKISKGKTNAKYNILLTIAVTVYIENVLNKGVDLSSMSLGLCNLYLVKRPKPIDSLLQCFIDNRDFLYEQSMNCGVKDDDNEYSHQEMVDKGITDHIGPNFDVGTQKNIECGKC